MEAENKKNILIVDDEHDLCEILSYNIISAGYNAQSAYSAEEALSLNLAKFDLILLDIMMGEASGFDMAKRLKTKENTNDIPIIFLTAKDTEEDLLKGFDLGADDYITKPFSIREVLARIKAVIARTNNHNESGNVSYEGIFLDNDRKEASLDGEPITLTRTEYEMLLMLIRNQGRVLSRKQLIEGAWPHDVVVTDRSVDVNITRIRKKIGRYSTSIVTKLGYGYYFETRKQ